MNALIEWVNSIKLEEASRNPGLRENIRRMVAPGVDPVRIHGLFRMEPQGAMQRFGELPEVASSVYWPSVTSLDQGESIGELSVHLSALLTLATDRRIRILEEASTGIAGTNQALFIPMSHVPDPRLVSPILEMDLDTELRGLLQQLCSLPDDKQQAVSEAISLHHGAALIFDSDISAAYTLLVAGLERLSQVFSSPKKDWKDWDQANSWDSFMNKNDLSDDQKAKIRQKLLKDKHLRIKQTFVDYVSDTLPDDFWDQTWKDAIYSINLQADGQASFSGYQWNHTFQMHERVERDRNVLKCALSKTYNARSGFVHRGARAVTPLSSIDLRVTSDEPVPFAVLRSMLTSLIKYEMSVHADDSFELPSLTYVNEVSK